MTEKTKKWTDEVVAQLNGIVGSESPVSVAAVEKAAEVLGVSTRSVAAKLRQLDREVVSMATVKAPAFTAEESEALVNFVNSNAGALTYKQIAEQFASGKFNSKQVQGKILALELTVSVKAAEKVEVAKAYTEAEEVKFVEMVNKGAFLEDLASAFGKTIPSVRGKALSLLRSGDLTELPKQKESHAKDNSDPVDALGDKVSGMTVAEIASAIDKTTRGVKTLLTRRGIDAKDYSGSKKKEKAEGEKKAAA